MALWHYLNNLLSRRVYSSSCLPVSRSAGTRQACSTWLDSHTDTRSTVRSLQRLLLDPMYPKLAWTADPPDASEVNCQPYVICNDSGSEATADNRRNDGIEFQLDKRWIVGPPFASKGSKVHNDCTTYSSPTFFALPY